jgi:1-acyl-sn-glycerol-3-phosphate acyltransferase
MDPVEVSTARRAVVEATEADPRDSATQPTSTAAQADRPTGAQPRTKKAQPTKKATKKAQPKKAEKAQPKKARPGEGAQAPTQVPKQAGPDRSDLEAEPKVEAAPPAAAAPLRPNRPSRSAVRSGATAPHRPRLQAVPPPAEPPDSAATATEASHRSATALPGSATGHLAGATSAHAVAAAERIVGRFLEAADLNSDVHPNPAEFVDLAVNMLRAAALGAGIPAEEVERRVAEALGYLRRRLTGDIQVDEFGFDEDYTRHIHLPLLRPLYRKWFRVEVRGIENIPSAGGALVVANHSGTVALDSLMTQVAVHDEHPQHRHLRMLGADLVFQTPFIGAMARRSGSTLAANTDAERLFAKGELVGVWPEGFKGVGKPFSERYKLQRFGRGGFVAAALRAGVPIVPCSIVGAEEIYPVLGNMPALARLLGMPYVPITPTFPWLGLLGLIPLPSKWLIEFGTPIDTSALGPDAADDPMVVFDLTDQVRETIQQTLYSLLMQRSSVFI